jgi:PiT family inorganic phosphate transporter
MVTLVIALALFFDFTNGFHDTANAMATPIATGALKPKVAVSIAAVLNLVGAFLSTEVARTISGGLIREGGGIQITPQMIFAGLIGAIVWNLATWLFGLPSSSSHALFGGLIGAVLSGLQPRQRGLRIRCFRFRRVDDVRPVDDGERGHRVRFG